MARCAARFPLQRLICFKETEIGFPVLGKLYLGKKVKKSDLFKRIIYFTFFLEIRNNVFSGEIRFLGMRNTFFQMRKYRSPIGKVVSCTKFLLIPTGVKSNKIIGSEEENRINQTFTYYSRKLGTRQKLHT